MRGAPGSAPSAAASSSPPARRVSCVYLTLFGSGFVGLGSLKSVEASACTPTQLVEADPENRARRQGGGLLRGRGGADKMSRRIRQRLDAVEREGRHSGALPVEGS